MKLNWTKEPEIMIRCQIVHRGVVRDLDLHHLSAADMDEADRRYPAVKAPALLDSDGKTLKDERGRPLLDLADLAYRAAEEERGVNRACYLAAMALGPEAFDARDIDGQMKELHGTFSRMAIISIAAAAYKDALLTPEMMEAAKAATAPFAFTDVAP